VGIGFDAHQPEMLLSRKMSKTELFLETAEIGLSLSLRALALRNGRDSGHP